MHKCECYVDNQSFSENSSPILTFGSCTITCRLFPTGRSACSLMQFHKGAFSEKLLFSEEDRKNSDYPRLQEMDAKNKKFA